MCKFPELVTERLILRKPIDEDVQPMLKLMQDEEVMEYVGMEPFTSVKEAREEIDWFLKLWKEKTGTRWIISLKETRELIGEIGYFDYEKKHMKAEIGYKLVKEHWRKGYMSEALNAVLDYIYSETDINRIRGIVDPRNSGSFLLLEKHRFQREGLLRDYEFERGAFVDVYMLSILRRDWVDD